MYDRKDWVIRTYVPNDELMVKERGEYSSRDMSVKRRIIAKERGNQTTS